MKQVRYLWVNLPPFPAGAYILPLVVDYFFGKMDLKDLAPASIRFWNDQKIKLAGFDPSSYEHRAKLASSWQKRCDKA